MIVGPLILWFSESITHLYIGRFLAGFGLGINIMICTIYLSECSPTEIRGSMTTSYQFANFLGIITSYVLGIFLEGNWSLMFGLATFPALA